MFVDNLKINKIFIQLIIIIVLLIFILSNPYNIFFRNRIFSSNYKLQNQDFSNKNIKSDKWIVATVFNKPSLFFIQLEKNIIGYKIVIVGNNETNDMEWNIFKSSEKLFYLSTSDQKNLKYNILKFLKSNSYYRKSIGYLYAIQHGAKVIYEIDEEIEFDNLSFLNNYFNNVYASYVSRNDSLMINPYTFFGVDNIWPRGFRINDIGKQVKQEFHFVNTSNINLKPLIFQGLINYYPDVDTIFYLTKEKINNKYNLQKNNLLIYFPNNYIPINSKNTRYLYEIFPLLMFPASLNENIADIWRGFIIQYFVWKMEGTIIYFNSGSFRRSYPNDNYNLTKEKKN